MPLLRIGTRLVAARASGLPGAGAVQAIEAVAAVLEYGLLNMGRPLGFPSGLLCRCPSRGMTRTGTISLDGESPILVEQLSIYPDLRIRHVAQHIPVQP